MLTSEAFNISVKLVGIIEQKFKAAEKALDYCNSCDEQFLNSVIELEADLKSAKAKNVTLSNQWTKHTAISLTRLQNKYLSGG